MDKKNIGEEVYFSDLEGLRIAMEMEERGHAFYRKAHDLSEKKEHKDLFAKLAAEENEHLRKFSKMYDELKEKRQAYGDEYLFDAETAKYLTALSSPNVFTKEEFEKLKDGNKSISDFLKMAIQDEKEAILFYDALAKNSKFENAREVFYALKAEEQTHIIRLRDMLLILG